MVHASPERDALRRFLWGKRRSRRHAVTTSLRLAGRHGEVRAVSVDLSAGGILVRVPLAGLTVPADERTGCPMALVETHFADPFAVHFDACRLAIDAEVVRLDLRVGEPGRVYLGCRFARPLDRKELRRFGLTPRDCRPETHALPSDLAPLGNRDAHLVMEVFQDGEAAAAVAGPVVGVGKRAVCGLARAPAGAITTLAAGGARLHLVEDDETIWSAGARLASIGRRDDDGATVELEFGVDASPAAAVKRHARRR